MTHKGKHAVVEDAFADGKSPRGSGTNTPARSRIQSPAGSAIPSPAVSGAEGAAEKSTAVPKKAKKLTRNQVKAKEERRRLRMNHWLSFGGPKPEDSDSD